MKNSIFIVYIFIISLLFNCTTTKDASVYKPKTKIANVSYETDIKPIMLAKCTPCHFPEFGKKKMLDTYESTKEYSKDIIARIQLPAEDLKFMPFKSKKSPLTENEIEFFKNWMYQKFPK